MLYRASHESDAAIERRVAAERAAFPGAEVVCVVFRRVIVRPDADREREGEP